VHIKKGNLINGMTILIQYPCLHGGVVSKDWEEFEKVFVDQFSPKNEQLTALTKLEGTGWYLLE
jgi:hypothetical protein